MAIRVVLAEDHYLVREGVRRLIEGLPELELAAVCEDLPTVLAAIDAERPDVVLTDIRMPPTGTDEGLQAAERLREVRPDGGVVLLSQYVDPQYALGFLEHGSKGRGYLLKERVSDVDQLLAAIRSVAGGGSYIDPSVIDVLVASRSKAAASPLTYLTARELEVLSEMAQGKSNAAIADALVLSERAVEKHISSIFSKLNLTEEREVHRRVKAVLLFLSQQGG
ncbi:MAG TPA: response regulator transcription factor [Acidimicrobiales bacterium]|jgi:DNA-binding NarL/FixJ family response regulator|nr:response regulator transcription factor [Acidimicrobiales bacterium]